MADFIPPGDQDADAWLKNLSTYVTAHQSDLGVGTGLANLLATHATAFTTKLVAHTAAQAAAHSAREAKDMAKADAIADARQVNAVVQANPDVTAAVLELMDLPVRDHTRTPVGVPTTVPGLVAEPSIGLQQTVRVFDVAAPAKRAKPAGVAGYQLLVRIAPDKPTDPTQCYVAGTATRGRLTIGFNGADAGKKAWVTARAVNGKGEAGPLAEPIEITIAA